MAKNQIVDNKAGNSRKPRKMAWIKLIKNLCATIKKWAEEESWLVAEQHIEIEEEPLGKYSVPMLMIKSGYGHISIEPVGREIMGADGRVEICLFPDMTRMILIRKNAHWILKTDSGVTWPESWSRKAFIKLVRTLTHLK